MAFELEMFYQDLQKITNEKELININKIKEFIFLCSKIKHTENLNNTFEDFPCLFLKIIAKISYLLDYQLLLSNAFFLTLKINKLDLLEITNHCIKFSPSTQFSININGKLCSLDIANLNQFKLTLIYGFLQNISNSENFHNLFYDIISFLNNQCPVYSKLFPLVLKSFILLLKKVSEWKINNLVDINCQNSLFNLIHCNWESPISGIFESNSTLFKLLIEIHSDPDFIFNEILKEQSWHIKSKYLMLKSLVPHLNINKIFIQNSEFFNGLIVSLSHTYLAPSGRDVYKILISNLSYDEWKYFCEAPIIKKCINIDEKSVTYKNFINYWLNPTIKTYPLIYDTLYELNKSTKNLFFLIHLIKIRKKNGINSNYIQEESKDLIICLRNSNEIIRSESFITLCVYHKFSENDFSLFKEFLNDNINSDSTPLRESLIKGMNELMIKLIKKILPLNLNENNQENNEIKELISIFSWLHTFLLKNLRREFNYQRKITSIKIYKIILEYIFNFKNPKQFKNLEIQKDSIIKDMKILFTSEESLNILLNMLFDPSKDVRDNISEIIIIYFPKQDTRELTKIGIELCSNSLFYKAASGALIFKIIAKWNEENNNLIDILILKAQNNLIYLKNNLLKAILEDQNVHGIFMSIQHIFSLENINLVLSKNNELLLLSLLEETVNYFLTVLTKDSLEGLAPSFSDMGNAIESLIEQHLDMNEKSSLLTPAHQLLFNCIWINLKESCMLASKMAQKNNSLSDRCGLIIIQVLKRCRHKGAIEAAGLALGEIVKSISKQSLELEFIYNWLQESLDTVGVSNSITRRSAGMAILVHQIVANDQRFEKPLLEFCIIKLLNIAKAPIKEDINYETSDIKQAISLHLFTILLKDSSLNNGLIKWLDKITLMCFTFLSSKIWTIRNGALQLFGAIVPKLIGQKKNQEEILNIGNISAEEFIFNFSEISDCLLELFKENINGSASLVPALTLCSKLKVGIKIFRSDYIDEILKKYIQSFYNLLSSKIYHIRRLSAKAYANFCDYSNIKECINQIKSSIVLLNAEDNYLNNNKKHGLFLTLYFLQMRYKNESIEIIDKNLINLDGLEFKHISFFTLSLLQDIHSFDYIPIDQILKRYQTNKNIGIDEWINKQIKAFVFNAPEIDLINGMNIIEKEFNIFNKFFEYLHKRIKENQISYDGIKKILYYICQKIRKPELINVIILKIIFDTYYKFKLSFELELDLLNNLFNYINEGKKDSLASALILPVTFIFFPKNFDINEILIITLINEIKKRSNPEIYNEDFRMYVSFSLFVIEEKMFLHFYNKETFMEIIIETCIILLQDENIEIRKQTSIFASKILKEETTLNPYICLRKLINHGFLKEYLSKNSLFLFYWKNLVPECNIEDIEQYQTNEKSLIKNPFQQELVNIYAEELNIIKIYFYNLSIFIKELKEDAKYDFKIYIKQNSDLINELLNLVMHMDKETIEKIDIYIIVILKKLIYILKTFNQLDFEENYSNYKNKLNYLLSIKKIY